MADINIAVPATAVSHDRAKVFETARDIVTDVLNIQDAVGLDQPLVVLGAQSYDFVQVAFRIENTFGVTLPTAYSNPGPHSIQTYAEAVLRAIGDGIQHRQ